jgi:hydroxyacylglutathione hydrolase
MPNPTIIIKTIPCLNDNYAYLIHNQATSTTILIDAPEAKPILEVLQAENWQLTDILITHHHHDHVGGVKELKATYGCRVIAPHDKLAAIEQVDLRVEEGNVLEIEGLQVRVLETPGHTLDHIVYIIDELKLLFSGDTLFSGGCGRVFEGTYEMMWHSLLKLRQLSDDYQVYFGHEYTATNLAFCLSVDKDNQALSERAREVEQLRSNNQPTTPVMLGTEKLTNVFLRADKKDLAVAIDMSKASSNEVFGRLRDLRNGF